MDTIENPPKITLNQNEKPKNTIALWIKFLILIIVLFMVAIFSGSAIESISEDFYWDVYIKIIGPIVVFIATVVFPLIGIICIAEVCFSLIQGRTESLARNNNQLLSQPKPNWIGRHMTSSLLIISGLLIVVIYLYILFVYSLLLMIGGAYYSSSNSVINPLMFYILGLALLELLIPFIITRSWALSKKRISYLLITTIVFTSLYVLFLVEM